MRDGGRARVEIVRLEAWVRLLEGPTVNLLGVKGRRRAGRPLKRFWVLKRCWVSTGVRNGVGFVLRADTLIPASTSSQYRILPGMLGILPGIPGHSAKLPYFARNVGTRLTLGLERPPFLGLSRRHPVNKVR